MRNICRLKILLVAAAFFFIVFSDRANSDNNRGSNFTIHTSFRDIPGVTEDETAAVESLRERYSSFVYAMPLSTEAFVHENRGREDSRRGFGRTFVDAAGAPNKKRRSRGVRSGIDL